MASSRCGSTPNPEIMLNYDSSNEEGPWPAAQAAKRDRFMELRGKGWSISAADPKVVGASRPTGAGAADIELPAQCGRRFCRAIQRARGR